MAQCYLAENDWEMEVWFGFHFLLYVLVGGMCKPIPVALLFRVPNSYFEPCVDDSALESCCQTPSRPETCVDLSNEDTTDSTCSKISSSENIYQEDGSIFSLITWNIDGLDLNLQERAQGACSYLALYSADVIFLQEVIPPFCSYLKKRASSYEIITGHEGYFTAIMLKKSRVQLKSQGKPEHCQYAWDMQMNSNLGILAACNLYFGGIFFRAATEMGHIFPHSLDPFGLEKLNCGRFLSDH